MEASAFSPSSLALPFNFFHIPISAQKAICQLCNEAVWIDKDTETYYVCYYCLLSESKEAPMDQPDNVVYCIMLRKAMNRLLDGKPARSESTGLLKLFEHVATLHENVWKYLVFDHVFHPVTPSRIEQFLPVLEVFPKRVNWLCIQERWTMLSYLCSPFCCHSHAKPNFKSISKIMHQLLKIGANPDALNRFGETALHDAAKNIDSGYSQLLLEHKSNPNSKNLVGYTPLHYAAQWHRVENVRVLLQHKAKLRRDGLGRTAFHAALSSARGIWEDCQFSKSQAQKVYTDAEVLPIVKLLADAFNNNGVDDGEDHHWPPLLYTIDNNLVECAKFLMQRGANASFTSYNEDGQPHNALIISILNNKPQMGRLFVHVGKCCTHPVLIGPGKYSDYRVSLLQTASPAKQYLWKWFKTNPKIPAQCETCGNNSWSDIVRVSKEQKQAKKCANPECKAKNLIDTARMCHLRLKKCGGCDKVAYCTPICQKAHWKVHKADCAAAKKKFEFITSSNFESLAHAMQTATAMMAEKAKELLESS